MNLENKFIVMEGPDGVGKTEVGKKLASILNYQYYKTPPESYRIIRHYFDGPNTNPMSRFLFYAAGVFDASQEIVSILGSGRGVVSDRYLQSLQVYHEVLTGKDLNGFMENLDVINPDLCIILTADINTLKKRRNGRLGFSDQILEDDKNFMKKIIDKFSKISGGNIFTINTNKIIMDEVVELCLKHISPY